MKAGFSEADVTPPTGIHLAGYPSRSAPSEGVDDPLYLRIAALEDDAGERLVLVTADLKHHTVDEHLAEGGCAVVDVAHWASEHPWCAQTAERLRAIGVTATVSELVTDPWTGHVGGTE